MMSKLWLACVLGCFLATRVEGVEFLGFIVGGELAYPRDFQYVVGLARYHKIGDDPSLCTGGIIHEKFVLTAAHCLVDVIKDYDNGTYTSKLVESRVFVYANTTNFLEDTKESGSGENRKTTLTTRKAVKAYFVTKYFTDGVADIAILELESPLNLNDGYHQKLNLPTGRKVSYEGVQAVLAGFGKDVDELFHIDYSLKKAHFRVVPYSKCLYPRNKAAVLYQENSMCIISVTEENEHPEHPLGACHGDSGGPLVQGNTVIGVLIRSSPITCDGREYPQTSVRVRYYKNFINSVIGNRYRRPGNNKLITEFKLA